MKNWKELYENLPSEELDKVAILRVMECSMVLFNMPTEMDKSLLSLFMKPKRQ